MNNILPNTYKEMGSAMFRKIINIILFSSIIAPFAAGQPKLSLNKPFIDLGTIYSGMKKKGTIVLKNIGSDTLRIYYVSPSCGCTTVKQPKEFLLPNESDIIEIEFNSTNYLGKPEKSINISTNDPVSQNVAVRIEMDIKMVLQPLNNSLQFMFGNVGIGKISMQKMVLKNMTKYPITILNISASAPSISVKSNKKTIRPDETVEMEVTARPDKIEFMYGNFSIETDSKDQPREEFRVVFTGVKEN
jgi:hypothetical protein